MKSILLFIAVVCLFSLAYVQAESEISIPFKYARGKAIFDVKCSSCHGIDLKGSETGPPLLHVFYVPSHHSDEAFYKAALDGVRAHHWQYGDMPPIAGMTKKKMDRVIPYIRYYQQQTKLY